MKTSKNYLTPIFPTLLLCALFSSQCNNSNPNRPKEREIVPQKEGVLKHIAKKKDTILVVTMDFNEQDILPAISAEINSFYHLPVKVIKSYLPQFAYYKPRKRFTADSLIKFVQSLNNKQYKFVVGLTSEDISTAKGGNPSWGIFGLGSLDSKGCVISSFRLKRMASKQLLIERIRKVALHEIGHNCGLEHCITAYPCFMKAADGKISEVDSEPMDMCYICRNTIQLRR